MKPTQGQIAVFLALAFLSVTALLAACLEASRIACLEALLRQGSESALRSVFAAYDGEMMQEYGLMTARAADASGLVWQETARGYAEKYLEPGAGTRFETGDRVQAKSVEAEALDTVLITEGEGRILLQEVVTYMKSAGLSILLQELLERLGLYSQEDGLGLIGTLKGMIDNKDSSIEGILNSYRDVKNQVQNLQEAAAQAAAQEDGSPAQPPAATADDVKPDLLEQIKTIRENGLIAIVTGQEKLSRYSWQDDSLPSRLSGTEKQRHESFAGENVSLLDHFLAGEFMMRRMDCYTSPARNGARYEIEYILTGKKTDKAALETVVGEILLIRVGFNLAYLLTDADKLAEAEALAAAIMTILALPELILLLKWLLVTAWALAESIVDIRGLLKGKKVPFWKNAANWQLRTLSLDLSAVGGGNKGFGYEDYLRLLFWLGRPEDQAYRMMDVMQKRLQLKNPAFLMKEYMVCAVLSVRTAVSYLYIQNPVYRRLSGAGNARKFRYDAVYSYGRR